MNKEAIKRTVRVTIEKVIEIEFTQELFRVFDNGNERYLSVDEYLHEFRKSLWNVDNIDDVAKYAAKMAADGCIGMELDGLGLLNDRHSLYPRKGDVLAKVCDEDVETEIIQDAPE